MEQAERDRLLAMVQSTPDRLKAALAGVPRKLLMWRPAAGEVVHPPDRLPHAGRRTVGVSPSLHGDLVTKDNPTFPDVDGDALALEGQYRRANLRDVLRDWRAARKDCLAVLKKVKASQWTRTGTHATAGSMSLETVLQRQALGNDEAHLAQIENIKKRWELLAKLQETPKALAALLRGVPDDVLRRKPAPEKWSMLELACHLRDVEEFSVERYGKLANHDRPQLHGVNPDELAAKLRYNEDDPALVLKEFQALRAETVAIVGALAHQVLATGGHASNARRGQLRLVRRAPGRA